ncbi:MAG: hypothetical protein U1F68_12330 [Gammaproteobacteria bacterium]
MRFVEGDDGVQRRGQDVGEPLFDSFSARSAAWRCRSACWRNSSSRRPRREDLENREVAGRYRHGFSMHDRQMPQHIASRIHHRNRQIALGADLDHPVVLGKQRGQIVRIMADLAL